MAGTVGAIFNGALQLGSAVGIAAISSIETSVERTHGGFASYSGRAAAWWFVVGVTTVEAVAVILFYRTNGSGSECDLVESPTTTAASTPVDEKTESELGLSSRRAETKSDQVVRVPGGADLESMPLPPALFNEVYSEATLTGDDVRKEEGDC